MTLPPIHLNLVIFVILVIEIGLFCNQTLAYLARPYEKQRLWHVILIGLLILYNIAENLVLMPDPHIPLSTVAQGIISESAGYFVTMYIPFYVYKTTGLERLRFHGRYGFLFLLIPTIAFFFIYYPITGDLPATQQYVYLLPACYAVTALAATGRAIWLQYREDGQQAAFRERMGIYIAVIFWCASPLIDAFLGLPKWVVGLFNNINFLILNTLFIRQTVKRFLAEYKQLQEANITLAEKVRERTQQLEKANEQKTNTFINLVHETKTPLTLINNYLDEFVSNHGYRDELRIVKNNIDKLNKDISHLFDLERYDKGFAIYNHQQVADYSRILQDHVALFRNYCAGKGITLEAAIEENVLIKADPGAINGIVNNLIENAVKYTQKGGKINVLLETADDKIHFKVNDNGIGITQELHGKIFEPYYQINSQKGGGQGMGLGLPIVKKTVASLHGEIIIESDPRQAPGTKVTVVLNRYTPSAGDMLANDYRVQNYPGPEMEELNLADADYDDNKQTILIVEDNLALTSYLYRKLNGRYNVAVALNGNEALLKMRDYPALPDLIISDVMMDKVDGFKFARIVSENPDYKHIPFIFLSARFTSRDRAEGLRLGAIDFIPKPFNMEELLLKIHAVLENAAKQKRTLFDNAFKIITSTGNRHYKPPREETTVTRFEENCNRYNLTAREIAIAKLIREGYSYKQIGESLFIAERTVKKHVQNIFEKVQISNKMQLINKLEA